MLVEKKPQVELAKIAEEANNKIEAGDGQLRGMRDVQVTFGRHQS